jgi:hypothetical protein
MVFLNEALVRELRLNDKDIENEIKVVEAELEKRNQLLL